VKSLSPRSVKSNNGESRQNGNTKRLYVVRMRSDDRKSKRSDNAKRLSALQQKSARACIIWQSSKSTRALSQLLDQFVSLKLFARFAVQRPMTGGTTTEKLAPVNVTTASDRVRP